MWQLILGGNIFQNQHGNRFEAYSMFIAQFW